MHCPLMVEVKGEVLCARVEDLAHQTHYSSRSDVQGVFLDALVEVFEKEHYDADF